MSLPLSISYRPMEAMPESELPVGPKWHYEPKWDGFLGALAFSGTAREWTWNRNRKSR